MNRRPRSTRARRTTLVAKDGPATVPTGDAPLDHLSFSIGRTYYNYLGVLQRVLAETGLDEFVQPGMGPIHFALFEQDDQVIKDLVERLQLSYSTISGMLSRMKRAGIVECRRDADDGRSIRVRLTPLGKSLESRCHRALAKIDEVVHAAVSPREARALKQGLTRLIAAMRRYDGRGQGEENLENVDSPSPGSFQEEVRP